ncbi:MAG: rRNA pseudouridine synthase [Oscillospiraceae bacterium]|nr:rRNA pseudouridine synthase [Oscillospiraceae bacterium]
MEKKIRIQKILSEHSISSRRASETLIREGKVKVNGKIAKIGDKIDPVVDKLTVSGKILKKTEDKVYVSLYKPKGYITTMRDDRGRKTVVDLVKRLKTRVYPVGRLDKDSEGLLILTNDGDFANFMMLPSKRVSKDYVVTVSPRVFEHQIKKLENPSKLLGVKLLPAKVLVVKNFNNGSVLNITLKEGKNRQIRKMCNALKLNVKKLKRVAIGGIKIGNLKPGEYKKITPKMLNLIYKNSKLKCFTFA